MAVNKPVGDNARKGAVKKRSQLKTTLGGATAWTKRNKKGGEFMAVKRPAKKTTAARNSRASGARRPDGRRAQKCRFSTCSTGNQKYLAMLKSGTERTNLSHGK
jgi:hypothetical protein